MHKDLREVTFSCKISVMHSHGVIRMMGWLQLFQLYIHPGPKVPRDSRPTETTPHCSCADNSCMFRLIPALSVHFRRLLLLLVRQRLTRTISTNFFSRASALRRPAGERPSRRACVERAVDEGLSFLWREDGWSGDDFGHEGGGGGNRSDV